MSENNLRLDLVIAGQDQASAQIREVQASNRDATPPRPRKRTLGDNSRPSGYTLASNLNRRLWAAKRAWRAYLTGTNLNHYCTPEIDRQRREALARQSVLEAPGIARTRVTLTRAAVDRLTGRLAVLDEQYAGRIPFGRDPRTQLRADLDDAQQVHDAALVALDEAVQAARIAEKMPVRPPVVEPILSRAEMDKLEADQRQIEREHAADVARQRRALLDRDAAKLAQMKADAELADFSRATAIRASPVNAKVAEIEAARQAIAERVAQMAR